MRDPLSWSMPLGRLFGITIRVHILFPAVALGLILRVAFGKEFEAGLWVEVLVLTAILFVSVLLHEFGHCFGARLVDGDAHEVLLWPLGGLAFVDVPHTPRANFIATAAGPAVNLLLCICSGLALTAFSLLPPFNPLADLYRPKLYNWSEHRNYGSQYAPGDLKPVAGARAAPEVTDKEEIRPVEDRARSAVPEERRLSLGQILLARLFFVNWIQFLFNLLPGFPLDGGRMLQCILWWRTDFRQAMTAAIYSGFVVMLLIGIVSLVMNELLLLCLALFIWVTCRQQWILLETGGEESLFGYDFSQGYTSLERDQPVAPRRRRPNFFKRWLQKRAQQRQQREQERREAEERRMDELLEKVQREGLQALSDEERRFLTRVSARYRNRH